MPRPAMTPKGVLADSAERREDTQHQSKGNGPISRRGAVA